jgi:hypothetical protein
VAQAEVISIEGIMTCYEPPLPMRLLDGITIDKTTMPIIETILEVFISSGTLRDCWQVPNRAGIGSTDS